MIKGPYSESTTNLIYNLLFCDNIELYKTNIQPPVSYPFDVLFSENSSIAELQAIIDDGTSDPRAKLLAYYKQLRSGHTQARKELVAVVIEVGLDDGLDVLAAFSDGTARYINQTGKILVWEKSDETSNQLTSDLFAASVEIVDKIGPWDQPRRPHPETGNVRLTFLVSDGLYFGEGPIHIMFDDPMSGPALGIATELLQYITEKA